MQTRWDSSVAIIISSSDGSSSTCMTISVICGIVDLPWTEGRSVAMIEIMHVLTFLVLARLSICIHIHVSPGNFVLFVCLFFYLCTCLFMCMVVQITCFEVAACTEVGHGMWQTHWGKFSSFKVITKFCIMSFKHHLKNKTKLTCDLQVFPDQP